MKILIYAPGLGKFTYTTFDDKIEWVEHWIDERAVKQKEIKMRPKRYTYFVAKVEDFMDATGITQSELSKRVGVSRKSINEYMSGKSIPKMSTMKKICDALGIEF